MDTKKEIIEQVKSFIQGGDKSDLKTLNKVLHEDFANTQNGFFEKKGVFVMNKKKYLSLISEKVFGGTPREMEIESIDVVGNIAMLKVNLKGEHLSFISFISLILDINEKWKVIGNLPYIRPNNNF